MVSAASKIVDHLKKNKKETTSEAAALHHCCIHQDSRHNCRFGAAFEESKRITQHSKVAGSGIKGKFGYHSKRSSQLSI